MNQSDKARSTTSFTIDGKNTMDTISQRNLLKHHYEDMAVPKEDCCFVDTYLQQCELNIELIYELNKVGIQTSTKPFIDKEVELCIKQMKTGKSPDEFGSCAEHLKTAGITITYIKKHF